MNSEQVIFSVKSVASAAFFSWHKRRVRSRYSRLFFAAVFFWIAGTAIFLGGAAFFLRGAPDAHASSATALSFAPHTFDLPGVAGERIRRTIKIRNNGEFAIPLRARVANFDAEDETGKMIVSENQEGVNDFSDWFSLDQKEIVIDAGDTERFSFSLDIPKGTPDGGYYAMIIFETDASPLYINGTKTQILPSAGVLVMLYVGEPPEGGEIMVEDYQIAPQSRILWAEKGVNYLASPFLNEGSSVALVADSRPAVTVRLKNNGTHHVKLDNKVKILGLSEKEKSQLDLPSITILPGKSRVISWSQEEEKKEQQEKQGGIQQGDESGRRKEGEDSRKNLQENYQQEKRGLFEGLKDLGKILVGPAKARLVVEKEGGEERYVADRFMFVVPWKAVSLVVFFFAALLGWLIWRKKKKHDKIFNTLVYKVNKKR